MTKLSSMVGSMAGPVSPDDLATFQRAGVATTVDGINRLGSRCGLLRFGLSVPARRLLVVSVGR